jgi:N-acetylglutamate synthase-like GNAT family acetyltransferase
MNQSGYTFILARWDKEQALLSDIQQQLFADDVITISNELAKDAFHILVFDGGGRTVGTARMQPDGKIEYVGVLRPWRGNTVGTAVMTYLRHIGETTRLENLWAMVPEEVVPFFEKNGYKMTEDTDESHDVLLYRMVKPLVASRQDSAALH